MYHRECGVLVDIVKILICDKLSKIPKIPNRAQLIIIGQLKVSFAKTSCFQT